MSNEFLDYVEDIIDAMEKAEIAIEGVTYEQFVDDFKVNFVVARALEIVGEAAKRLPMSLRTNTLLFPGKIWPACATALFTVTTMLI